MVSQHERATRMQGIKKIRGCWRIAKFKPIMGCFSSKGGWIGANQILQAEILAMRALEDPEMLVTLQGLGAALQKSVARVSAEGLS